jgi:hypothetical protein
MAEIVNLRNVFIVSVQRADCQDADVSTAWGLAVADSYGYRAAQPHWTEFTAATVAQQSSSAKLRPKCGIPCRL